MKTNTPTAFPECDKSELVDIRDVSVDPSLPREERIAEFVRQIKNPYLFRCGDFIIHAKFDPDGLSLEDCLKQVLL